MDKTIFDQLNEQLKEGIMNIDRKDGTLLIYKNKSTGEYRAHIVRKDEMEIESEVGTIQGDETIECCVKLRFAIVGDIAFYHTILGRSGGYIWCSMVLLSIAYTRK